MNQSSSVFCTKCFHRTSPSRLKVSSPCELILSVVWVWWLNIQWCPLLDLLLLFHFTSIFHSSSSIPPVFPFSSLHFTTIIILLCFYSSTFSSFIFLFLLSSVLSFSSSYRTNDSGLITHKESLPVRSLVLGDIQRPGSEAAYRVGPLRCNGDSKSLSP